MSTDQNETTIISGPAMATNLIKSHFSREEDIQLCQSYLYIAYDAVRGSDQKAEAFWERVIADYYSKVNVPGRRANRSLSYRWSAINKAVCRYAGIFSSFVDERASGTNATDIVS